MKHPVDRKCDYISQAKLNCKICVRGDNDKLWEREAFYFEFYDKMRQILNFGLEAGREVVLQFICCNS